MEKTEAGNVVRPNGPEFVDVAGLAEYLKVSVRFVRRLVAERRVPVQKMNSRVYFDLADIRQWLAENKIPTDPRWS